MDVLCSETYIPPPDKIKPLQKVSSPLGTDEPRKHMGKAGIIPNTWTKSSLATAIPSASQVPAESGTPPVDQPLAAVTPHS